MLKATKADNITLCLWTLIKDAIDEGTLKALDIIQGGPEASQEKSLSERTSSGKGPINPKLEKYRDTTDELTLEKEAHLGEGADKYHSEDWPPNAPSVLPMTFIVGDDIQRNMQLQNWSLRLSCRS